MSNVNYNQMSNKTPEPQTKVTPETPVNNAPTTPAAPKIVTGVVSGCEKLNVRKQPNIKSDVVRVIDKNTEVVIDESKSTEEFYRVRSASETNSFYGFCMKQYITVKQ